MPRTNVSQGSERKRQLVLGTAAVLWASIVPAAFAQDGALASASANKFYAFVGGAALAPSKNSQLHGEHATFVGGIAGAGYRISQNLAVELNYLLSIRTPDTPKTAEPPAGTFKPGSLDSTMLTLGIAATVKYRFAVGRLAPYAGGGFGAYRTRWDTTSDDPSCANRCTGNGPGVSRHSNDLGYHALAGADYHITAKDMVAAELRYLKLDADFGDIVPGKVHVGGTFLWLGYRRFIP